ncbi:unnamed protein product [Closterium sp. Naga37s-1]|nr:unnamed protein product [Closterium sp. Naga37s-1]
MHIAWTSAAKSAKKRKRLAKGGEAVLRAFGDPDDVAAAPSIDDVAVADEAREDFATCTPGEMEPRRKTRVQETAQLQQRGNTLAQARGGHVPASAPSLTTLSFSSPCIPPLLPLPLPYTLPQEGEFSAALAAWDAAIGLSPLPRQRAVLFEQKAQVLMEMGRLWEAVRAGTCATDIAPDWHNAWVTLARAQLNFGEPHLAQASFSRALLLQPGSTETQQELREASRLAVKQRQLAAAADRCPEMRTRGEERLVEEGPEGGGQQQEQEEEEQENEQQRQEQEEQQQLVRRRERGNGDGNDSNGHAEAAGAATPANAADADADDAGGDADDAGGDADAAADTGG